MIDLAAVTAGALGVGLLGALGMGLAERASLAHRRDRVQHRVLVLGALGRSSVVHATLCALRAGGLASVGLVAGHRGVLILPSGRGVSHADLRRPWEIEGARAMRWAARAQCQVAVVEGPPPWTHDRVLHRILRPTIVVATTLDTSREAKAIMAWTSRGATVIAPASGCLEPLRARAAQNDLRLVAIETPEIDSKRPETIDGRLRLLAVSVATAIGIAPEHAAAVIEHAPLHLSALIAEQIAFFDRTLRFVDGCEASTTSEARAAFELARMGPSPSTAIVNIGQRPSHLTRSLLRHVGRWSSDGAIVLIGPGRGAGRRELVARGVDSRRLHELHSTSAADLFEEILALPLASGSSALLGDRDALSHGLSRRFSNRAARNSSP